MGLFGIDVSLFKDEGARKLIAACVAMVCVTATSMTAMILTKSVAGIYEPTLGIIAACLSVFVGGNVIEGIKKTVGEIKLAKINGQEKP